MVMVFKPGHSEPLRRVTPAQAIQMVKVGSAVVRGASSVFLTDRPKLTKSVLIYGALAHSMCLHHPRGHASELIARGLAEKIDATSVRLTEKQPVAVSSPILNSHHQEFAYESAAIESKRKYVGGGLNRTEHQPAKIRAFKGARVGHQ